MRTSVIVIGWNESSELRRHLSELSDLSVPPRTELVAVVGGDDRTYQEYSEWCESQKNFDKARCIEQEPADGYSGAVLRAVEASDGSAILHAEMDTEIPPNWILAMRSALEDHDAVTCRGKPRNGLNLHWAYQWIDQHVDLAKGRPQLSGAQTMGFRREVLEETWIDEPLPSTLVDWRISQRVHEAGYSVGYVRNPPVSVSHVEKRSSFQHFLKMQRNSMEGLVAGGLLKQAVKFTAVVVAPVVVLGAMLLSIFKNSQKPLVYVSPFLPVFIISLSRDLNDVRVASHVNYKSLLIGPVYILSKQVLYLARSISAWTMLIKRFLRE